MFRKKNRQVQVEEITIGLEKYILRAIDKGNKNERGVSPVYRLLVDGVGAVFIDSTNIKACANKYTSREVKVTKPIK